VAGEERDQCTGCHAFGVTGGAIRLGDFKLLVTHPGRAPWEDSSPAGIGQGTAGGRFVMDFFFLEMLLSVNIEH
jgi:hypothetical protein